MVPLRQRARATSCAIEFARHGGTDNDGERKPRRAAGFGLRARKPHPRCAPLGEAAATAACLISLEIWGVS